MKKLLILAALLTVGAGAFAQAKAGSLGVKAGVGYESSSLGLDFYLSEALSVEPTLNFSLASYTYDILKEVSSTGATRESPYFGGSIDVLFHSVSDGLDIGFGPGAYLNVDANNYSYNKNTSQWVTGYGDVYGLRFRNLQTISYGATLGAELKYFVAPRLAVYSKVGGSFGTSYTSGQLLDADKKKVAQVDESYYRFRLITPALGVVFYLN